MNPEIRLAQVAHNVLDAGTRKPTLALLDYTFRSGGLNVVGGPSGAGKTTLLSILSLAIRPAGGTIYCARENLSALNPSQAAMWRCNNIGLIFQTTRLVKVMTVHEHIRLAALTRGKPQSLDNGLSIIERLGLGDKLDSLPHQLSGGEKQRIAVAQALCFRPSVLLADEPTAALDLDNASIVTETLRSYAQEAGAVVICVSHDRVVIDAADDVLRLEKP